MQLTEKSKLAGLVLGSVICSLLVFGLGFELVLRGRYAHWKVENESSLLGGVLMPSPDAGLIWENRPGFATDEFRINRWGFRDAVESKKKPEGVYRVAFVGDSVTFGAAVTDDELFVSRLGRALAASGGRRVEAMNFSVSGYNTLQLEELIGAKVTGFAPDLVVYVLCLNDFDFDDASGELMRYFRPPPSFFWERLANALRGVSARDYHEDHFARNQGAVFESIRRMQRVLAERGAAFEVMVIPVFDRAMPSFREYPYTDIHDSIARFLDDAKVRDVDLLPAFRACSTLAPDAYAFDVWHLRPLGHQFVARAAAGSLLAEHAPQKISDQTCAELGALEPAEARTEGTTLEAALSNGAPARLGIDSSLIRLERFWPIEREPRRMYAWSREHNVIGVSHLHAGASYALTLLVADSAGRPKALVGPKGGALQAVALDGAGIHLPEPIIADATGHLAIEMRVDTFRPSARGLADNRELGVALSGVELRLAPGQEPPR